MAICSEVEWCARTYLGMHFAAMEMKPILYRPLLNGGLRFVDNGNPRRQLRPDQVQALYELAIAERKAAGALESIHPCEVA